MRAFYLFFARMKVNFKLTSPDEEDEDEVEESALKSEESKHSSSNNSSFEKPA